jgi:hypothetical protein
MEEGFFFDRIDMPGDDLAIDECPEDAIRVFPDRTNASFPRRYRAVLTAEMAFDLTIPDLIVEHRFFHGFLKVARRK